MCRSEKPTLLTALETLERIKRNPSVIDAYILVNANRVQFEAYGTVARWKQSLERQGFKFLNGINDTLHGESYVLIQLATSDMRVKYDHVACMVVAGWIEVQ